MRGERMGCCTCEVGVKDVPEIGYRRMMCRIDAGEILKFQPINHVETEHKRPFQNPIHMSSFPFTLTQV
jgi:hypothetical protein